MGVHEDAADALAALEVFGLAVGEASSSFYSDNFYAREMKGTWTATHTGMPWDRYLVASRAGYPTYFCVAFNLPRWKTWSRVTYGDDAVKICGN